MQDYTGMFEKVALDVTTLVIKEASPEDIFNKYNKAGKIHIDMLASDALRRHNLTDTIRKPSRGVTSPRLNRATLGSLPLNRNIMRQSEHITRNRLAPTAPSKVNSFRNPVFAAANASSVPSLGGIAANAVKRRLFK